jgi:hypothetical protein
MFYDLSLKFSDSEKKYFNISLRNNNASNDALFILNINIANKQIKFSFRHIFWIRDFELNLPNQV